MLTHGRPWRSTSAGHPPRPAVTVTAPLGPDWTLAEIGVRRLFEAGARSDDTIVLAADAADDRAVADVGKAARLLSAVWGGRVHVGTLGGPDTPLGDAVDVARAYSRRVVVSSYVLTPGAVHDSMVDGRRRRRDGAAARRRTARPAPREPRRRPGPPAAAGRPSAADPGPRLASADS